MTLSNFITKYLNLGRVEYHSFGPGALYQCVDLANQYIVEVLGLTPIIGTNAKDFPERANKDEFEWIVNTPEAIIKKGDIPVWNGNVGGGAGHIAICREDGTLNQFKSLDQNWSQVQRVTLETHNYLNVIGWLRPKQKGGSTMVQVESKVFENLVAKSTKYDSFVNAGYPDLKAVEDKISRLVSDLDGANRRISELEAKVASGGITEAQKADLGLLQQLRDVLRRILGL